MKNGDAMRLDTLLDAVGLAKPAWTGEWPRITGVASDSRRVRPGDLFVAIVGERFDGRRFVPKALESGAVAILGPAPENPEISVPWVEVADPRPHMGALSSRAYGLPGDQLRVLGVTGTNGKSTLVNLLASMLEAAGEPSAHMGTLGYFFADEEWQAGGRTTPEASDLHRVLAEMLGHGARGVAMEVSSHALELGRVEHLEYDLAAFTNLSRDHLDFHGDMENYFVAKRRLFDQLKPDGVSVVHLESSSLKSQAERWGYRLAADLRAAGRKVITCGDAEDADVRLLEARLDLGGIEARLATPRGELLINSRLLGRFHLLNLITAAACGVALDLPAEAISAGLAAVEVIPGRLEPVPGQPPSLVDYAHTPAALEAALAAARELSTRPLVAVFGCGGERDRGKRPEMGFAAGSLSDLPILTSDNPRREDPLRIMADAEVGLKQSGCTHYLTEPDRRAAIHLALEQARALDGLVVVAGRGHEAMQDLGDRIVPFDDRDELRLALEVASHAGSGPTPSGPSSPGRHFGEVSHG